MPIGLTSASCAAAGCLGPASGRGYCHRHFKRLVRTGRLDRDGDVMVEGPKLAHISERSLPVWRWQLLDGGSTTPCPLTGCELWTGALYASGYGKLGHPGTPWGGYAHRAALHFSGVVLQSGNMGLHVRHTCNQPACVNPRHLVYGTAKENVADRTLRYERGELRPRRLLTDEQIAYAWAAHEAGVTYADLGRALGASWATVRRHVLAVAIHHQQTSRAA